MSHWNEHKEECERLEQQMKRADVLNDFPFTFSQEATATSQVGTALVVVLKKNVSLSLTC